MRINEVIYVREIKRVYVIPPSFLETFDESDIPTSRKH